MADEKQLRSARNVYDSLCEMLDGMNWRYNKFPEDLVVRFDVTGDDLPMQFIMAIDAERQLVRLLSPVPAKFGEDKRVEGAIATNQVNYGLADGSFDYNYEKGEIHFRMTSSFRDSLISKQMLSYMVQCACYTVDKYNDKFFMLAHGQIEIEEFFKRN